MKVFLEVELTGDAETHYKHWIDEKCPGQMTGEPTLLTRPDYLDEMEIGFEADFRNSFYQLVPDLEHPFDTPDIKIRATKIEYN